MTKVSAATAGARLNALLEEVSDSHRPVTIAGKRSKGVLISEEDWRAIQETLYLSSIPGMKESIIEGLKTPVAKCSKEISW